MLFGMSILFKSASVFKIIIWLQTACINGMKYSSLLINERNTKMIATLIFSNSYLIIFPVHGLTFLVFQFSASRRGVSRFRVPHYPFDIFFVPQIQTLLLSVPFLYLSISSPLPFYLLSLILLSHLPSFSWLEVFPVGQHITQLFWRFDL